ncbi:uncharacterized protein A4U43_C07F5070 [Asparagus officinalis]|uniref:Uncharacterized protein n=1 Tax=Asparagus officinalis TaxID=4686 RepID=A0A5P1E9V5_ASPOF|nr:uncharacterized protein A4U43_C07F5070 [Asparagus officinalis]
MFVLDDVWDVSVWEMLLRNPLSVGVVGSRVLVTTRDERVANRMRAVYCHKVDILSPEDGWSLLCKKLVPRGKEWEIEHLQDIGIKIVEKRGVLPLAIKAMGGALCEKSKSRSDWEAVLESNVWSISGFPEQVNRALYWSYLQLPPHLKQCFLWWFLLPKGYDISMYEVVDLWTAEGFIKGQGGSPALMDKTGHKYYKELVCRSFLQLNPMYFRSVHMMHDLLRSLAEFLSQDESLFVDVPEKLSNKDSWMRLRRLSIEGGELHVDDILRSKVSLRTLI